MKSANAFAYAMSGNMTESQIQGYQQFIQDFTAPLNQLGGWLGEKVNAITNNLTNFVNSRAWEMGKRLLSKQDGEYVSRFEIGYLGSITGLQNAQGFMRDYIMANPLTMQDYLDGEISGYGGNFSAHCAGIAEDNIYYRKAMNGLLNLTREEEVVKLRHTHYHESLTPGLSFRERVNIQKTWAAQDHHRVKSMFDFTSEDGNKRKSFQEPEVEPPADE